MGLMRGFILAWSLMLSLLLSALVLMGSHGSSLALRSSVNQGELSRVEALAALTLSHALGEAQRHHQVLWAHSQGRWPRYQAGFSPLCAGGLCAFGQQAWPEGVLSGSAVDPARAYVARVGQRVVARPRYVWQLLGRLPDGRIIYLVTVRAWGVDRRTQVTLSERVMLPMLPWPPGFEYP